MAPVCWLCGSLVLLGEGSEKGLCPPFCVPFIALMPDTSVSPCMPLLPFNLLCQCWSSQGLNLSKSVCGSFKRNCLGLKKFLPPTQSLLGFAARSYGDLLPGTGTLGWCLSMELRLLTPEISLPNFYPSHLNAGTACSTSSLLLPVWMDVVSLIL